MKLSNGEKLVNFVFGTIMVVFTLSIIYPLLLILARSFSSDSAIFTGKVLLWPVEFTLEGYHNVIKQGYIYGALLQTIKLTIIGTAMSLTMTLIAAYPLSKKHCPCRNFVLTLIIITMFFQGGLIPSFLLYKRMNLLDTFWVLILPGIISTYNLMLVKNFYSAIPDSLEESAKIDGANDLVILVMIYIPLSVPVIATIALFLIAGFWNTFMSVVLFTSSQELKTFQVVLRDIIFVTQRMSEMAQETATGTISIPAVEALKNAAIIVTIVPMLLVYPFIQRYFIKGIMLGAIKG